MKGTSLFYIFIILTFFTACESKIPSGYTEGQKNVSLIPDYTKITVPPNIAPLNFRIKTSGEKYIVQFKGQSNYTFAIHSSNPKISIPQDKWKKLMSENKGKSYSMDVFVLTKENQWIKFPEITNFIAEENVDPYLVYRLIEPGYELWNEMGIYQRCLENFDEKPIMINRMSDKNCMNCHSFCNNDPSTMMLHMRAKHAGTYILKDDQIKRVNTKAPEAISAGVYPSWSPDGTKIAFSTNKTIQFFHAQPNKRVEVVDLESDIVIYDVIKKEVITPPGLNSKERFETFPNWSADGNYLYFCSAEAKALDQYNDIRYSLLRIQYDKVKNTFGAIDTLVSAFETQKSVSFPRISPDNKTILFTLSTYGNFSIWHSDADLYLLNLENKSYNALDVNSERAESYHSWSSNGKWFVFSSRRDDGQYTRSYFAYIDSSGKTSKPFILPQKNPDFYDTFLKAYNVPELVKGKVKIKPDDFKSVI